MTRYITAGREFSGIGKSRAGGLMMDYSKNKNQAIVVFESQKIRRDWHQDEWWFSVVDICGVLSESVDAGAYWRKLKQRLKKEGSEVVTICHGLKLEAADGKKYRTDCANTEGIFRIIHVFNILLILPGLLIPLRLGCTI